MSTARRKPTIPPKRYPLELLTNPPPVRTSPPGPIVGECLDARHPTLVGRVLVRFQDPAGEALERWVPALQGLVFRESDRVLLLGVEDADRFIAIGVVDGWRRRDEPPRFGGLAVELKTDETLRVVTEGGDPLVEIVRGAEGPVVRLLQTSTQLELPGKLSIRADEIELRAERGGVTISAPDDVVIRGETIQLN